LKKKILNTLKYLAFFAAGAIIFWVVYKDQDIDYIKSVLTNDVKYFWIWFSIIFGLLSHISRSMRWNLMIEPLGYKPRLFNTFLAVMIGYLMNLVLPRMGEISRCGVLAKYEKISFAKLVGTVVTERIIDVLMLLLFTLFVFATQFGEVLGLLKKNPEIGGKVQAVFTSPVLWIGFLAVVAAVIIFRKTLKNTKLYQKVANAAGLFKEGLISVKNMKRKWAFIGHSFFIWTMYFMMMYVVFDSFEFTSNLSFLAGLTCFVIASFGMVAPVQGGIGAYHFMLTEALLIYGVASQDGSIFAFVVHSTTTLILIVGGLISLLILPFYNRNKDIIAEEKSEE
jgi:hypothetical protein